MTHWLGEDADGVQRMVAALGMPAYRAKQVADWVHGRRVDSVDAMTNIPAALRTHIAGQGALRSLTELDTRRTDDGLTTKWLFRAADQARLEAVLIIEKQHRRRTVCVSSMSGCPLGCLFCATGAQGYTRSLGAGEIVEQVYRIDAAARALPGGEGVSHIVFMGMGEPLLNLDAVLRAAAVLTGTPGLGLSGRHVTISTAGVPDGIRRLARAQTNYRLAVSLHAPDQATREKIMPSARTWPLPGLLDALDEFADGASRDLTFEYCLLDRVNATPDHAKKLARLLSRWRCKVNLIPFNSVDGTRFTAPSARAIRLFQTTLEDAGIPATVRMEKGADIGAACGQLAARERTA